MKKSTLSLLLALCLLMSALTPAFADDATAAAQAVLDGKEYANVYKSSFSTSYPSLNYYATSYGMVREFATNCIEGLV